MCVFAIEEIDNMRRLGHINQRFGSQEHRLDMGGCVTPACCDDGLCVIISTADGLPPCRPDCYPLHHTEHASEACDILHTPPHTPAEQSREPCLVFSSLQ